MAKNRLTILSEAMYLSDNDKTKLIIELLQDINLKLRVQLILGIFDTIDSESLKLVKSLQSMIKSAKKLTNPEMKLEANKLFELAESCHLKLIEKIENRQN
jgi:hypothetical protein